MGRHTGPVEKRIKERCTERLLAEPGLQHDEAQAALAVTFSLTAMESPSARLDEASLALFGAARLEVPEQAHALADPLTNQLCPRRSKPSSAPAAASPGP